MADAIKIFIPIISILFILSIFVPIVNIAFGETSTTTNNSDLVDIFSGSDYLSIGLNLVTCMFWTFGLPAYWNLILIIPRIIGLICLYYIILPTK